MKVQPFLEDAEDLYQNAPFGYLTMRADGLIVNINTTLLTWLGFERNEIVLQQSFQDLLSIGGKIYMETHLMPMLQLQGEISEINIELKGKHEKKLPVLINAKRVERSSEAQPFYRFSVLDISQRKQYEWELMEAKKKAEHTVQRLNQINQELEQFAYVASHDLQAPLRTIAAMISLLERKGYITAGSDMEKYFSLIKNNSLTMKLMIGDLLDYAKIDGKEAKFETISLNEVCNSSLEMIQDQVNKNNASFVIPELPVVVGEKLQLIRLFQNLFSNAIKYRSDADPVINVTFEDNAQMITVFIKDNGIGFEQSFADQVFVFMKRLHANDSIPGTGIGLSACKRILENHGGTIDVTSAPGEGSTFYFTLPKEGFNNEA